MLRDILSLPAAAIALNGQRLIATHAMLQRELPLFAAMTIIDAQRDIEFAVALVHEVVAGLLLTAGLAANDAAGGPVAA